tara:strand:- start:1762 stop:1998 length:237 start_codon:yes stop_codon:yes gene_type:complete
MNRKTLELLLVNYQNLHNSMSHWKTCTEKEKFVTLIAEVELQLKNMPIERIVEYSDGLTAMEFAKKLASEANERDNNE